MDSSLPSKTTYYLKRIQRDHDDQGAWGVLYLRYAERFYGWCRKRGLGEADAEEVTSAVFTRVVQKVDAFDRRRGPARAWLFMLIRTCLANWFRERQARRETTLEGDAWEGLAAPEAGDDLQRCLDLEHDTEVLLERLKARGVNATTLEAFRLVTLEGLSAEDAAVRLGIPAAHVQRYMYRVRTLLREEAVREERDHVG